LNRHISLTLSLRNDTVFDYREIMPADRNAYLAEHNRLTMTLDYNLAIMHPQLPHIISIIRPAVATCLSAKPVIKLAVSTIYYEKTFTSPN
jgi:hypothetical protein